MYLKKKESPDRNVFQMYQSKLHFHKVLSFDFGANKDDQKIILVKSFEH